MPSTRRHGYGRIHYRVAIFYSIIRICGVPADFPGHFCDAGEGLGGSGPSSRVWSSHAACRVVSRTPSRQEALLAPPGAAACRVVSGTPSRQEAHPATSSSLGAVPCRVVSKDTLQASWALILRRACNPWHTFHRLRRRTLGHRSIRPAAWSGTHSIAGRAFQKPHR